LTHFLSILIFVFMVILLDFQHVIFIFVLINTKFASSIQTLFAILINTKNRRFINSNRMISYVFSFFLIFFQYNLLIFSTAPTYSNIRIQLTSFKAFQTISKNEFILFLFWKNLNIVFNTFSTHVCFLINSFISFAPFTIFIC